MSKNYQEFIKLLEGKIKRRELLASHTTFKIGGPADLFYTAKTEEEVIQVVNLARKNKIPFLILGNGSNLLISDKGFEGLVLKIKNYKLEIFGWNHNFKVVSGAGVYLSDLLKFTIKNSLTGLEFLAGIPATVGGAIRGNAGAWRQNIGDKILKVKVLDKDGKILWVNQNECNFSYRESRFKKSGEIVLEAEFLLEKDSQEKIKMNVKKYLLKRKNQPKEPSAGCIFINPKPLSAGELIERCGLKGKRIGDAQISPKHANFIVNLGRAKASEVMALIQLAKKKVKEKFGVDLKEEIVIVGDF